MLKPIKRMVLTGAAVMVMMSLTTPAMAYDFASRTSLASLEYKTDCTHRSLTPYGYVNYVKECY